MAPSAAPSEPSPTSPSCRSPTTPSTSSSAIEVLEHVPDPARALSEIRRVGRESFVLSVPREPVWRIANVLRGRYVRDLGNTPGHVNHWSTRRFRTLVDTYLDLRATRTPFPWTLVAARRRPPPLS